MNLHDVEIPEMSQRVMFLRQSTLCMLCEFKSQFSINGESRMITYSNKMCGYMKKHFFGIIQKKYGEVLKFIMYLDEWVYLLSLDRIIETEEERFLYKRYL